MTVLNKQALRKLAKALSGKEWVAFVHKASGTYAVGSLGHERGEDIIKWPGLDGQDNAENKAKFIGAANPSTVLALLDELEAEQRICSTWRKTAESNSEKLESAEKRIAELEAKLANPVLLPKTNGYWTEQEKAHEEAITLAKRQIRLAGFRCEGDE